MYKKYIHHIHLPLPSPYALSPPTGIHHWTGPVLPSCPSVFKVNMDCSGEICLDISHIYVKYTYIYLYINPSISYYHPDSLLLNSFQCISLCHLHTQMQCMSILFTFCYSLFFSHLSVVSSDIPTIKITFSLSLYVCIYRDKAR
jgi:hypothetical protein